METTSRKSQEPTGPRTIKRYANRKLYDTRESRYVTLKQIADYVRAGEEVAIVDNTTKEDLTNVTLAQIVYEEEKKGGSGREKASAGKLRGLIQEGGEKLMTTLRTGPVGKLIAREKGDSEPPEPVEAPRRSMFASSKEALDELQRLADDRVRGVVTYALDRVHGLQGEVGRLQTRIDDLEARLVAIQKPSEDDGEEDV